MVSSTKWHDMEGSPVIVTENVVEYRKAITELITAGTHVCVYAYAAYAAQLHWLSSRGASFLPARIRGQ
jgi:hypothetical protein